MITKEELTELFADMAKNAPWDVTQPLLWGYFFADGDKHALEKAALLLKAQGYKVRGIYLSAKERPDAADLWWLHIEKVEKHNVDSLHQRNQDFYAFAEEQLLQSYDGMDVGPAA